MKICPFPSLSVFQLSGKLTIFASSMEIDILYTPYMSCVLSPNHLVFGAFHLDSSLVVNDYSLRSLIVKKIRSETIIKLE